MAPALATAPLKAKARVAVSPDLEPMFRYTVWVGGRNEMTTWQHSWQLELTVLPSVETTNDRDYLVGRYLKYGKSKIFLQNRIVILIHCRLLTNALTVAVKVSMHSPSKTFSEPPVPTMENISKSKRSRQTSVRIICSFRPCEHSKARVYRCCTSAP